MPADLDSVSVETSRDAYQPDEALIELIWQELDRQFPIEQVRQIALGIAAEYQDATVTTYIPIFVWRQTHERLAKQRDKKQGS
jgi:hypothetical protein